MLLVTTSYPERGDGSEAAGAFVAELAAVLARQVPVRVVAPGRDAGSLEEEGGIRIRRFASPGRPLSLLSPSRPSDWPAIVATLRSLRRETLAEVADGGVAHVVALWVLPSGWAAAAAARRAGVPYSVWALGSDIWTLGRLPLVRGLLARVSRGARARYADGLLLADDATRIAGQPFEFLPSTRASYPPQPSPLRGGPRRRLLFLGRWHPNKGVDLLFDALERLDDDDWARIAEVHVAGGGPLEDRVRAGAERLRAAGRPLRLSGFLDAAQARAALAEADQLLIPSRIESIPLVFSDAMRAGCLVVATPVGDLPGLVAGEPPCGVVAAEASAEAFALALSASLHEPRERFAAGIARRAAEFSLEHVARVLLERMDGS